MVATKVIDTVITSSPGPMPAASSARCSAEVPLLTARQCRHCSSRKAFLEGGDLRPQHELRALDRRAQPRRRSPA